MNISFKLLLVACICFIHLPSSYNGQVTTNNTNCSFQTATVTINNVTTFIQYQACQNQNATLNVTDKYVFNIQMFQAYEVVNVQNDNRNTAAGNTNNNNNNIVFSNKNPFNQTNTNKTIALLNGNYNSKQSGITNDNNNNILLGLTNDSNADVKINNNNRDGAPLNAQQNAFGGFGGSLRGNRLGNMGAANNYFGARPFGGRQMQMMRVSTTTLNPNVTTTTRPYSRFLMNRFGGNAPRGGTFGSFGPWFGK